MDNILNNELTKFSKLNRTFSRRIGKSLSDTKKNILETELPKRLFSPENFKKYHLDQNKEIVLEIGFGMGEHLFNQLKSCPEKIFIGADVYMNGVASLLEMVQKYESIENEIPGNIFVWSDDVDLLFELLPDKSLSEIYALFPDPWHKRKHHKKRLLSKDRMPIMKSKLKENGSIFFASDISDYSQSVIQLVQEDSELDFVHNDFSVPHKNYNETKYHKKALEEGRHPQFMQIIFMKNN